MSKNLVDLSAVEVVGLLRDGKTCPLELLSEVETRHKDTDGKVNALPIICFEKARVSAQSLMQRSIKNRGVLCGLPVSIKDLSNVAGVATTYGSPIFSKNIAPNNSHVVDNIETSGGVVYAKSNTPEFGAGASTFNPVFGITRNPHDLTKSAAGSSGGAAASLAAGSSWLAHGSDNAGSLRTPASFCGVVGLRPSPGRVPRGPGAQPYQHLSVDGPMARNVSDAALFLDAMVGEVPEDALSLGVTEASYLSASQSGIRPRTVAFSPDLGLTPVDPEVAAVCEGAAKMFERLGVKVRRKAPDFVDLKEHYRTLRAFNFAVTNGRLLKKNRALLKPDIIDEFEKGLSLDISKVIDATRAVAHYRQVAAEFFREVDVLITPASIVPAFDAELKSVTSCNGVQFEDYLDWLEIAFVFSFVSLPVLAMPAGYTATGLPIGIQLVSGHRCEAKLLSFAKILEDLLEFDLSPVSLPLNSP